MISVEQFWLIPQRLVFVRFTGHLTVEDIGQALEMSMDFVDNSTGEHPIHFLHDWTGLENFPTSIGMIRQSTRRKLKDRSKLGWVIAYGSNQRILRFVSDLTFQVFKIRFRMVDTEAEAVQLLQQIDPTLPSLPAIPTTQEDSIKAE